MGTGRWVLVTGATSGIGEACVTALVAEGFSVFAGFRSKTDGARLLRLGPAVIPLKLDVTVNGTEIYHMTAGKAPIPLTS